MPGGLDFGDLPTWLTAATPAAVAMIEGRRRKRVAELGRKVEELVQAREDKELVNRAVEDAARTTWQESSTDRSVASGRVSAAPGAFSTGSLPE